MYVHHWVHRLTQHLWYERDQPNPLLVPFGKAYGHGVSLVREAYDTGRIASRGLPVPVIVVGNITVGGTGKTPLTIWLAQRLKERGYRPGILSRGYGGITPRRPLEVTINTSTRLAGDEPVMMARKTGCPVFIFPKRVDAGHALIARHGVDILIADDGLQHHELERDLEIAVVDGSRGFGNGHMIPAGPLREPIERLDRVDFVVHNGGDSGEGVRMHLRGSRLTNLRQHCMKRNLGHFKGQKVHAIAGIGNPDRFFRQLIAAGLEIEAHPFPDHHAFTAKDLAFAKGKPLLMTEKDAVKCMPFAGEDDWFLPVDAELPNGFIDAVIRRLKETLASRS
jgi:tetraacyldisaccharide 4'-kinase